MPHTGTVPFPTVSDLKSSETYRRSPTLQRMPAFRLQRFIEVFNSIFAKQKAAGKADEAAESTALSLAYAAAERFQPTPSLARIEKERHLFATLMPLQFSMGGDVEVNSFDYVRSNIETMNAAIAGNGFNLDHDHTQPTGVIHRLLLPEDPAIPADVRAKMDPDTPFLVEGSFYEDTPDAIRAATALSAEWLSVKRKNGPSEVVLPDSFCIVMDGDPATDESLGVRRLSKAKSLAKAHLPKKEYRSPEAIMPDDPLTKPDQEVASLRASLEKTIAEERNARLQAESKFATLETNYKATQAKLEKLAAESLERDAQAFAAELFRSGKCREDEQAAWAKDYKDMGAERVSSIAARLAPVHLGEAKGKATATAKFEADKGLDEALSRVAKMATDNLTRGQVL